MSPPEPKPPRAEAPVAAQSEALEAPGSVCRERPVVSPWGAISQHTLTEHLHGESLRAAGEAEEVLVPWPPPVKQPTGPPGLCPAGRDMGGKIRHHGTWALREELLGGRGIGAEGWQQNSA